MNENIFILELELALKQLPAEERNDIVQDIREYFTNGREDGKTDSEIAASLGSPDKIAEELIASYTFTENVLVAPSTNEIITIKDDSYTNIDINVQHGALLVSPSNNNVTTVELISNNDKLQLSAEVTGDTLFVRLKSTRHWLFMFNFSIKAVTLHVFIPKKLYQSIAMKTDNGRISAEKLLGKSITVKTDNGKIHLNEIATTTMHAETDNGRIEVGKVQADNLKVKTDNGRIEMCNIETDTLVAESDNGRIALDDVHGNLTAKTDNGRITLQTDSLDRNIDFRTDNGSIELQARNEPTNVAIHAKTGHGKIDVFGERNSRTIIGAGEHTIRLKSDNGRITVKS